MVEGSPVREIPNFETKAIPHPEFLALSRLARSGDAAARDRMVRSNVGLVVHLANYYVDRGLDFDDLAGHGFVGLIHAVDRFDPDLNIHFATYASHWIKQAMRRAIHETGRTIRIPIHLHESAVRLNGLGRRPASQEDRDKAHLVRQADMIGYADRMDRFGEGETIAAVPGREADPAETAERRDEVIRSLTLASDLLGKLGPVEQDVVRSRLGIGRPREQMRQISARYHKTPRWSHYIYVRAIDHLRAQAGVDA
jgi:RNA polymerase sigma factor (sigma-70 family)